MRATTTLLLLLITGVVGYFVLHTSHGPGKKKVSANLLFDFKTGDADRISISGKNQTLLLEKRHGQWWITDPLNDRANPEQAEAVLRSLAQMENVETLSKDVLGKDGWKHAGLNGTSIGLEVFHGSQKLASCRVGAHSALEDAIYIRLPDRDPENMARVVRLNSPEEPAAPKPGLPAAPKNPTQKDLPALVAMSAADWRDPLLLRVPPAAVQRITISAGNGVMEFKRGQDRAWSLVKPLTARASEVRVNAVLHTLLHWEARPATQEHAPDSGTATLPLMQVVLEMEGDAKPVEISLQPAASGSSEILATLSNRAGYFSLPAKAAEIWRLQPNDMRDPQLAHLDPQTTNSIHIRSLENPEVVMEKAGATWMLRRFGKEVPANQERVAQLFDQMNGATIREFSTDAPGPLENYGLATPFMELEWQRAGDAKATTLQFGQSTQGAVYAKYSDELSIYRISPLLLTKVATDSLKWQSLTVLSFNTMVAHRIIVAEGAAPPLSLLYDPDTTAWSGNLSGRDISSRIDRSKANALLNLLADFKAETWVTERTPGYEALRNPTLTVQLLLGNPSKPDAAPQPRTLIFAPTGMKGTAVSYYGRLDANPDLFLITKDAYDALTGSVLGNLE